MLVRRWTPPSQVPVTSWEGNVTSSSSRTCLRWCKLIISALLLLVLLGFCVVYTLQKERLFTKTIQKEEQNQLHQRQQSLFDAYIEQISSLLSSVPDKTRIDTKYLADIRTKTLMALRNLDLKHKREVLLFLYEQSVLQNSQLNLHGAHLNDVELICPHDFSSLHLPGVIWTNAVFINCRLVSAVFSQAHLLNARFINSTLQNTSFLNANLDHSQFANTIIRYTVFNGASMIQADFCQASIFQGNNFSGADLYQAKFTDQQLERKPISTLNHDLSLSRMPNGSFGASGIKTNLVVNGDAEIEYDQKSSVWKIVDQNMNLSTGTLGNTINSSNAHWGNHSFIAAERLRAYQEISLRSYSLLIDTDNAAYSFSAFANCEQSYFEIHIYRADDILQELKKYSKLLAQPKSFEDEQFMHLYNEHAHRLPMRSRSIRIYFGIDTIRANVLCYFDNITLSIHQSSNH